MTDGRRPTGAATMKDVAREAGVHVSVISRYLSNDPRLSIAAQTRERIDVALRELRYRPNLTARALRTSRTHTIAFLVPEFTNPLYGQLVAGAYEEAAARGYSLVLGEIPDEPDDTVFDRFRQAGLGGTLFAAGTVSDETTRWFLGSDLPVVVVNRQLEGFERCASVDDAAAMRLALDHLRELGHVEIGMMTGPTGLEVTSRRVAALQSAAEGAGATVRVVAAADVTYGDGHAAGKSLLATHPGVTAVVSPAALAIGLAKAAREAGLVVPDDLSIVTLHDLPMLEYFQPALTAVALPMEQLGARACDLLLRIMEGEEAQPVFVDTPPRLVRRASTAPVRQG